MTTHYVSSDGNGGFNISKSMLFFAMLTFILVLLSTVAVSAIRYGTLEEKVAVCDRYITDISETYTKNMVIIENRLDSHSISIEVINTKLDNIDSNVKEIKNKLN